MSKGEQDKLRTGGPGIGGSFKKSPSEDCIKEILSQCSQRESASNQMFDEYCEFKARLEASITNSKSIKVTNKIQ